jgi:hypothetical protein
MFIFIFIFIFYKGRLTPPSGEKGAWSRFILGGFVDYSFPLGLFLMHFPTIPLRLFIFCKFPLACKSWI